MNNSCEYCGCVDAEEIEQGCCVERLRSGCWISASLGDEAADKIEKLEAKNLDLLRDLSISIEKVEQLEAERDNATQLLLDYGKEAHERIEQLKAALRLIADCPRPEAGWSMQVTARQALEQSDE